MSAERRSGTVEGVHVAIVRDNEDPEGLGRVRLEYPWRETTALSPWARIAVPMAGAERGTFFLPEPGDEVLVAFVGGDIDHPYVLGALWNGEDAPPAANRDGENDDRVIASRAGHEVAFDDGEDGGHVRIETAGGHRIELVDDAGDEAITITNDAGTELELDGADVTISSTGTVTIDATGIAIESAGNLDIDAGGALTLQGTVINLN